MAQRAASMKSSPRRCLVRPAFILVHIRAFQVLFPTALLKNPDHPRPPKKPDSIDTLFFATSAQNLERKVLFILQPNSRAIRRSGVFSSIEKPSLLSTSRPAYLSSPGGYPGSALCLASSVYASSLPRGTCDKRTAKLHGKRNLICLQGPDILHTVLTLVKCMEPCSSMVVYTPQRKLFFNGRSCGEIKH